MVETNTVSHYDHCLNVYWYHVAPPFKEFSDPAWAQKWLMSMVKVNYINAAEAIAIRKACKELLI